VSEDPKALTVLVVEDELFIRMTIVEFLRSSGCDVIEAASGEKAVEVLQRRNGIDVVFTDIQLGGMLDGWDVGETSRVTHPMIPVVYTSGAALVGDAPLLAAASSINRTNRRPYLRPVKYCTTSVRQ